MRAETRQHMMAILPDGLYDDQRRVIRDVSEHLHPITLAVDESMTFFGIDRVAPFYLMPKPSDSIGYRILNGLLGWPTELVC